MTDREAIVVVAERNTGENIGLPDPATVALTAFRLVRRADRDAVGHPNRYFDRIATWRTTRRYCNSNTALAAELGLSMPKEWPANNLPGGCP